jgi:hypothetical protein
MTRGPNGGRPGPPRQPPRTQSGQTGASQLIQPPPPPSLDALTGQFDAVRESNQAKLAEMARQGVGVDPMDFLHARIDALIDSIAQFAGPNGPRWALMTRLSFEQQIAAQLDGAQEAGRRADLAIGGSFTPGMIAQLARASGTFQVQR